MPEPISDMNRNQDVLCFADSFCNTDEPLMDINLRNLENLSLIQEISSSVSPLQSLNTSLGHTGSLGHSGLGHNGSLGHLGNSGSLSDNNENLAYFQDNLDSVSAAPIFCDDPREGNISRQVRVPSSEHVAEIVGRQGNEWCPVQFVCCVQFWFHLYYLIITISRFYILFCYY